MYKLYELFSNNTIMETTKKNKEIDAHFHRPAHLCIISAKTTKNPVLTRARLKTNIAPIAITALLEKPLNISS